MADLVMIRKEGPLVELQLNRPEKLNALTGAMYDAIASEFLRGCTDHDARVFLISSKGSTFTSGNDIGEFMHLTGDLASSPQSRFVHALTGCSKPIVAAVQGAAVGIGTTMLLHCDLVYAGIDALFSAPFVSMGLVPEAGSSMIMPQMFGFQRAAKLLLLGERITAEQAQGAGLVTEIVSNEALYPHARSKALRLAAQPPDALAATRQLMRGNRDTLQAHIERENDLFRRSVRGSEAKEAFAAFMEKRTKK